MIDAWDPDVEPERFASGWSHALAEPFLRLRSAGRPVTIGAHPPAEATVMFALMAELTRHRPYLDPGLSLRLALAARRCPTVVIIRNDSPLDVAAPRYAALELMPNAAAVQVRLGRVMLPLPQRGLVARNQERGERIEVVAIKARAENVPDWLEDLRSALAEDGVKVRVDDSPATWPAFNDVDIALCARKQHRTMDPDTTYRRKPPTKLLNAWAAGAIPIVAPEQAYLELIRPGTDALVADGPDAIADGVRRLQSNPASARLMRNAGMERAKEFSLDAVLAAWTDLLDFRHPATALAIRASVVTQACRYPFVYLRRGAGRALSLRRRLR